MIQQFIPYWGQEEKDAVMDVLDGDFLLEHKKTREFEKAFAEFVGAKYCITCTSGTVALYLAIMAKNYKHVAVPSYQGLFAANASLMAGAAVKIFDVDKNGSFDNEKKQWPLTNGGTDIPKITVHANGRLGGVDEIEDCAQAISHHTIGKTSCYSFASTKHITTSGQGGAVCTDDKEMFDKLTELKDQGRTDRQNLKAPSDTFEKWGTNFKFTEIQAAFGLAQLKGLPKRLERLRAINMIYYDYLADKVEFKDVPMWYIDIFTKDPDKIVNKTKDKGFVTKRVHKPIHMQPLYEGARVEVPNQYTDYDTYEVETYLLNNKEYPISRQIYDTGVFLPSTTNLTDEEVKGIGESIRKIL